MKILRKEKTASTRASFTFLIASGGRMWTPGLITERRINSFPRESRVFIARKIRRRYGGRRRPEVSMSQQGPDSNLEDEAEIKISRGGGKTSLGSALLPTRDNFVSRGATAGGCAPTSSDRRGETRSEARGPVVHLETPQEADTV